MKIPDNQLLSITQACELLRWRPQRMHYYFQPGRQTPPHSVQGGIRLFDEKELMKWKKKLKDHRIKKHREP